MSNTTQNPPAVGMIGLGAMGWGMAKNLHQAGLLKAVWNRSQERTDVFAGIYPEASAAGVVLAEDLTALTDVSNIIVICVSADPDMLEVVNQLCESIQPNTLVIDCSTVSITATKAAAKRLRKKQCQFIDAPVSGGMEGADKGQLSIMVGGDEDDYSRANAIFAAIGKAHLHMGELGAGQSTKAVNQIMAAGINQAVCEALSFAESADLDVAKVIEVVGSGAAGNWFINHRGMTMVQEQYEPGFKVEHHLKDLNICQQMAENMGIELPLTEITIGDYEVLMEEGFGEEDISALYRLMAVEE